MIDLSEYSSTLTEVVKNYNPQLSKNAFVPTGQSFGIIGIGSMRSIKQKSKNTAFSVTTEPHQYSDTHVSAASPSQT